MKKNAFVWMIATVTVFGGLSGCTSAQAEEQKIEVTLQDQTPVSAQREAPLDSSERGNHGKMVIGKVIETQEDQFIIELGEMPEPKERPERQESGQLRDERLADGEKTEQPEEPLEGGESTQPKGEMPEQPNNENLPNYGERGSKPGERKQKVDQINWTGEQETIQIIEGVTIHLRQQDTIIDGTIADLQEGTIVRLLYTANENEEEVLSFIEVEQILSSENQ